MAGDWIPMRLDLLDDPAVIQIALTLGMEEYAVAGRLLKLWGWANRHLKDGHAFVPDKWIDSYLDTAGFAAALLAAGWLRARSDGYEFTSFDRWNSQGAKIRLGETLRKKAFRARQHNTTGKNSVPEMSRTKTPECPGPEKRREEKRREENIRAPQGGEVEIPPELATDGFRDAWSRWLADRKARKLRKLSPDGERTQLRKLAEIGPERSIACIEASIANGWQGLFPDKYRTGQQSRNGFQTHDDRVGGIMFPEAS